LADYSLAVASGAQFALLLDHVAEDDTDPLEALFSRPSPVEFRVAQFAMQLDPQPSALQDMGACLPYGLDTVHALWLEPLRKRAMKKVRAIAGRWPSQTTGHPDVQVWVRVGDDSKVEIAVAPAQRGHGAEVAHHVKVCASAVGTCEEMWKLPPEAAVSTARVARRLSRHTNHKYTNPRSGLNTHLVFLPAFGLTGALRHTISTDGFIDGIPQHPCVTLHESFPWVDISRVSWRFWCDAATDSLCCVSQEWI